MKFVERVLLSLALFSFFAPITMAGIDLRGTVNTVWLAQDGTLWFKLTPAPSTL